MLRQVFVAWHFASGICRVAFCARYLSGQKSIETTIELVIELVIEVYFVTKATWSHPQAC